MRLVDRALIQDLLPRVLLVSLTRARVWPWRPSESKDKGALDGRGNADDLGRDRAEEYEAARKHVNWEGDVPPGAMFHVVAVTDSGVRVTDVWESGEAFDAFVRDRLMPGVQELGIPGQPQVEILPAHAIFAPAYDRG